MGVEFRTQGNEAFDFKPFERRHVGANLCEDSLAANRAKSGIVPDRD